MQRTFILYMVLACTACLSPMYMPAHDAQTTSSSSEGQSQTTSQSNTDTTIPELATKLTTECQKEALNYAGYLCSSTFWRQVGDQFKAWMTHDKIIGMGVGIIGYSLWDRCIWKPWFHRGYAQQMAQHDALSTSLARMRTITWIDPEQLGIGDYCHVATMLTNLYTHINKEYNSITFGAGRSHKQVVDDIDAVVSWLTTHQETLTIAYADTQNLINRLNAVRNQIDDTEQETLSQCVSRWYTRINGYLNTYTYGVATIPRICMAGALYYAPSAINTIQEYIPASGQKQQ